MRARCVVEAGPDEHPPLWIPHEQGPPLGAGVIGGAYATKDSWESLDGEECACVTVSQAGTGLCVHGRVRACTPRGASLLRDILYACPLTMAKVEP